MLTDISPDHRHRSTKLGSLWSDPKTVGPGSKRGHMPKFNNRLLQQIRDEFCRYGEEVETTDLKPSTKKTYILHARNFVRWLDDDFEPGSNVKGRSKPH